MNIESIVNMAKDRNLLHFSTVCDGQTYGQTLYVEMIPYDYLVFVTF